jgi:hypothetical protein
MSYVNNIPTCEDPDLNIEERNTFMSAFVGNDTHHSEPFTDIFFPIVNEGDEEDVKRRSNIMEHVFVNDVVGVVTVTFYWRDVLKHLLPDRMDGLHIVVENTCNQTFTYTWSESELIYVGAGDFHDSAYDECQTSLSLEEEIFSSTQLGSNGCEYIIHTYPSSDAALDFKMTQKR